MYKYKREIMYRTHITYKTLFLKRRDILILLLIEPPFGYMSLISTLRCQVYIIKQSIGKQIRHVKIAKLLFHIPHKMPSDPLTYLKSSCQKSTIFNSTKKARKLK